jgi:phospholipase C
LYGVRVPTVIVSPYVRQGSIIRPAGATPFDHTSILATLRKLFGFPPLTNRDAGAPDLLPALGDQPSNDGPPSITAPAVPPAPAQIARSAAKPLNGMQKALATAAFHLPTAGADIAAHVQRLSSVPDVVPFHATVADAVADIRAHVRAFLGRS